MGWDLESPWDLGGPCDPDAGSDERVGWGRRPVVGEMDRPVRVAQVGAVVVHDPAGHFEQ